MRRGLIAMTVMAAVLAVPPAAGAALTFRECDQAAFRCARLTVPLDRTGQVKGKVSLRVLRARATGRRKGVVVLFAGGPGQSAVSAYGDSIAGFGVDLRRTHDLVLLDQRGSGRSGLLRCPELEKANILRAAGPAARCATKLGAKRAFYASRDTADDVEALRRELRAPKLSLYGVSYGTRTAAAYALRYPAQVDRMAWDSVLAPDGADALSVDAFRGVPRVLRALCQGRRCRGITRDPVADVAALVQRLAVGGPMRGRLPDSRGRTRTATLTRYDVFSTLVSGDFEPTLRAAYPGAVRAALAGDPVPLLRLKRRSIALESEGFEPEDLSTALYAATTCAEARLPWPRSAPIPQRRGLVVAAVGRIAPAVVAPFDTTTLLGGDTLNLCSLWPPSSRDPTPGPGALPDVPILMIEGADDLRTPVETARDLAAGRRNSRVFTVPNVGHSPGGVDRCASDLAPRFLAGRPLPRACRPPRAPAPTPVPPASLKGLSPAAAVARTLADVEQDFLFVDGDVGAGLRGGTYVHDGDRDTLRLRGFSFVPGLRLTGRIDRYDSARRRRGTIRVSGPRGYRGTLRVRGTRVSGRLGGRRVRARLGVAGSAARARGAAAAYRPRHQ